MPSDALARTRLTSFAPQFLVTDLEGAVAWYRDKLGFTFGEPYEGIYAIGTRDGLELHLKEAARLPGEREHRRDNEHLDACAGVEDVAALYDEYRARGATIVKPLGRRPWGTRDFYVEGPEGHIIAFSGR